MSNAAWQDDPRIPASALEVGDVIYGTDTVTALYRHPQHGWRVVAQTTAGEYSFPEATTVPVVSPSHEALQAGFRVAFDALRSTGLEHDADHPVARRYRAASDAVNHSNRKQDRAIAAGRLAGD